MQAIRVHNCGGPEVLIWETTDEPTVDADRLLVRVEAAGVNYIDTYHRTGLYPMGVPFTPGLEGAGTVIEAGGSTTGFAAGDRVAWSSALGSYAEVVSVPARSVVKIDPTVEFEIAAAVMLQGMTAHYLAIDTFPLAAGDRCLIHAGAGGVGLLLIQIAKLRQAEVFTTVGSEQKAALAKSAGADHVILYDQEDFGDAVERVVGENGIDVVYDGVGASTFDRGLDLIRPRGMMVLFGQSSGPVPPFELGRLNGLGSLFVTRPSLFHYISEREDLERRAGDLFTWIAAGDLNVRIGHRYPMGQAADAHRALEGRATTGKVLLIP